MQAGHVVMDSAGHLLSVDQTFCAIMHAEAEAMLGRQVLDITAPADRPGCGDAIRQMCETRRPFQVTKRLIRDDESLVWVTNSVSIMPDTSGTDIFVATIDPLVIDDHRQPARLLDSALFLESCKHDRAHVGDAALFPDTAWDIMLVTYIAEATGQAVTAAALAARLDLSPARAERWIGVLLGQDALEIETRKSDAYSVKCYRLTGQTHRRLEEHLVRVNLLLRRQAA